MDVILSIKPEFVEKIFDGSKKYEFRRRIFSDIRVKNVIIYATAPICRVVGKFKIESIIKKDINNLWLETSEYAGISKEYFYEYFKGLDYGYAIKIKSVHRYVRPRILQEIDRSIKVAPQSFYYIKKKSELKTKKMIFVGGIHGVGKSYLCNEISNKSNIKIFSASKLIESDKNEKFGNDKLIRDIKNNQNILVQEIDKINTDIDKYILDGHFCLFDNYGKVKKISKKTFSSLRPSLIIVITDEIEKIVQRLYQRDGVNYNIDRVRQFQETEIQRAIEIGNMLKIRVLVHKVSDSNEEIEIILRDF